MKVLYNVLVRTEKKDTIWESWAIDGRIILQGGTTKQDTSELMKVRNFSPQMVLVMSEILSACVLVLSVVFVL